MHSTTTWAREGEVGETNVLKEFYDIFDMRFSIPKLIRGVRTLKEAKAIASYYDKSRIVRKQMTLTIM